MAKYPTIKATLSIIRDMGLTARYAAEHTEFQVTIPGRPDSTYYTESRHDAIMTAVGMTAYLPTPHILLEPTRVMTRTIAAILCSKCLPNRSTPILSRLTVYSSLTCTRCGYKAKA